MIRHSYNFYEMRIKKEGPKAPNASHEQLLDQI